MSEFNEKNDKKVLKINSMYGLAYFILSIWVICACIAVIVFGAVKKDLAFLYVVVAIGFAYCGTILTCEIIRNLKEKATAISKKVICDYLSAKYSFVESNHRTDYTKPANGQTQGLLLPDTHYVVAHGEKVCFLYVYENNKHEVHILLKVNAKQFKKIEKAYPKAVISNFPKVANGDSFCRLDIDSSVTREKLFEIIDEAIDNLVK